MAEKKYIIDNPTLMAEWDWEKNNDAGFNPNELTCGSKYKAWWICRLGHSYQSEIHSRNSGRGCPVCHKEYKTSFPEQAVFYYVKKHFSDAINGYISDGFEIDIYIPSLSFGIEYDGMAYHTGEKSKSKESRKNDYCKKNGITLLRLKETRDLTAVHTESVIWCYYKPNYSFLNEAITLLLYKYLSVNSTEVDVLRDSIDIQDQYVFSIKEKSIATIHPDLVAEWHPTKNGTLKPEYVRAASNKKYWWLCKNGHEYEMTALNRHYGIKCPYCSGRRILVGYNDLNTLFPQIAAQWDYSKNGSVSPSDVTTGTNRKFWWKCEKGHSWETSISTRVQGGNCPYCSTNQAAVSDENCLATLNPVVAKEWDYEKNGELTPKKVRANSEKQVWWRCKEGHSWRTSVKVRNNGNNCPYCGNQQVLQGFNDLATTTPELAMEWDYEKNGSLLPTQVISYGRNKIWWKCEKGHSYKATIGERKNGNGCPYCAGRKVLEGFNDLLTTHPKLCLEWDYNKNATIAKPNEVSKGSHIKVWWLCSEHHHSYMMPILNRTKGYNCPYCSGQQILIGFNDLQTTHPQLCNEWNYTKNGTKIPSMYSKGSSEKVWWICHTCKTEWSATISNRSRGQICPNCAKIQGVENLRNTLVSQNGSFADNFPQLLEEWNFEKNVLDPSKIPSKTPEKVWWICKKCSHEWEAAVYNRANGAGCPKCADNDRVQAFRKTKVSLVGSFADQHPHLLEEWDYDANNDISPYDFTSGSTKKVWWKCPKHNHSWQGEISKRVQGQNCPFCSGRKVLQGFNDLAITRPDLMIEWNFEKNTTIKPTEITKGSGKKVWWICKDCRYEWESTVVNRTYGTGCPNCYKTKK